MIDKCKHEESVEEREIRLRQETAYAAGRDVERKRTVAYLREMNEPAAGYYSHTGMYANHVHAVVTRLATDIELGTHRIPTRENNPELWK